MLEDRKLGQILIEAGLLNKDQLQQALVHQKEMNSRGGRQFKLGEILLFTEVLTLPQLQAALRKQTHRASESREVSMKAKQKQVEEARAAHATDDYETDEDESLFGKLRSFFKRS